MPPALRPARIDATPRRAAPQQVAAWRRLAAWIVDETTRLALEARKAAQESNATDAEVGQEAGETPDKKA